MKSIALTFTIFLTFFLQSNGQINPVNNLTWDHWYEFPNNYFILEWEEPDLPHNELIGYNVYRENELFIFVTDTSIFNLTQGSNCGGEDFLLYNIGNGFFAHVVAVYNPGAVESTYTETIFIDGPVLDVNDFERRKAMLYPNPTNGILNIVNENLTKILIFNISGKVIKEFEPNTRIDLSDMSNGIYLIKLISDEGTFTDKIIIR